MKTKLASLRAGVSVTDVTPPVGYRLAGHAARTAASNSVHDPLRLKVLTLNDGKTRVALITSDLIGFGPESVARIRDRARKRLGLKPEQLMLTASHTHTGPCTYYPSSCMPSDHILPDYIRCLELKVVGGIIEAMNREERVTARWAEERIRIGAINRRKMTPAGLKFAPNPDGPVDDTVNLLRLDRADGRPLALVFRAACHPTTLAMPICSVSADYPGVSQRLLEQLYPGAIALFIQGCCGDVRPGLYKDGEFLGGTHDDADRMGRLLAAGVCRLMEEATSIRSTPLSVSLTFIQLPFDRTLFPTHHNLSRLSRQYTRENPEIAGRGWVLKWIRHWRKSLAAGQQPARFLPMGFQVLRIGDVTLGGLAAEVMAEYGDLVRQALGGKTIVAGYANGEIGYLPTAEAIQQGGYEAASFLYENYPAPFDPQLQKSVLRSIRNVVK